MLKHFSEALREDINDALDRGKEKLSQEQLKGMINRALAHCNLVTREEMDTQIRTVDALKQRVAGLEARVTLLESERGADDEE